MVILEHCSIRIDYSVKSTVSVLIIVLVVSVIAVVAPANRVGCLNIFSLPPQERGLNI